MDPATVPRVPIGAGESSVTSLSVIGLGTWRSRADELTLAVSTAIEAGYRHFDCAHCYENEATVGAALSQQISEGHVKREELFIVSKLWNTSHSPEDVKPALKKSLGNLQLDYLDLYLIHWPYGFQRCDDLFPMDTEGNIMYADTPLLDTWKAMEKCLDEGLVKSIGLSNSNSVQIQDIIDNGRIEPAVLQVEIHPYFSQQKLVKFCQEKGVVVTAYCPLASNRAIGSPPNCSVLFEEPVLKKLAAKYSKSPAQIILRWLLQRNIVVIPKSVTPARIKENIQVFDFQLTADDMEAVNGLNKNHRFIGPFITKEDGSREFRDKAAANFAFGIKF